MDVSLLLSQGHPAAARYPLWRLGAEAEIARDRLNGQAVTHAILLQKAIASIVSEEGGKAFKEIVEQLSDGG